MPMVRKTFMSGDGGYNGVVAIGTDCGQARDHCSTLCFDIQTVFFITSNQFCCQ